MQGNCLFFAAVAVLVKASPMAATKTINWEIGPTPSIEDEKAMRKFLILNRNKNMRGRDLPHARRELIKSKGSEHGFTIQGAMSQAVH